MRGASPARKPKKSRPTSPLMVRLDPASKAAVARAAQLRRISISDYVRAVMVPQAHREVLAAEAHTITLTPEEQLAFWNALNAAPRLTAAQERLGAMMRGEA